jgi:hypothetical protein
MSGLVRKEKLVMSNPMTLECICEQILAERRAEAQTAPLRRRVPRRRSDPALWLSVCIALPYVCALVYFVQQIRAATA